MDEPYFAGFSRIILDCIELHWTCIGFCIIVICWIPLNYVGYVWFPLNLVGFVWYNLDSVGFNWMLLNSFDFIEFSGQRHIYFLKRFRSEWQRALLEMLAHIKTMRAKKIDKRWMRMRAKRGRRRRRRERGGLEVLTCQCGSVGRAMGGEGRTIHSQAAPLVRPVDAGQHFKFLIQDPEKCLHQY